MQYSKQDAVYNLSRSALMVASLSCGKAENLRIAVQDKLINLRVDLIENCAEIFELTYQNGSLGTYITNRASARARTAGAHTHPRKKIKI